MAVSKSQILEITKKISKDIEKSYEGLSLYFVLHGNGQMREALDLAEHEVISHQACDSARTIIRNQPITQNSNFLGLAIGQEKKFFGLKKVDHILGIFNINHDEFKDESDARSEIYALAWHAIDLYEIRQQKRYKHKFAKGPMVPKRSEINFSKASLQADIFAITLSALKKEDDLFKPLFLKRAENSLLAISNNSPAQYPSVIAMDAYKTALKKARVKQTSTANLVICARTLSVEVGHAFNVESVKQWWNFSIPAQDMAWRGINKEDILGAALHTSADPYVRSIGYLIQEVTGIKPSEANTIKYIHNSFVDEDILTCLHKEIVDTIFEDAISQGMKEASHRPFLNAANKLNEALTEGRILGWCSNALNESALAFERALLNGAPPEQAARMQFNGNKAHPKWSSLKELGEDIIDQKRKGFAVTMGHIAEICHNNSSFSPILESIQMTMKDPAYLQKLEAANDLNITPNIPKAPSLGSNLGPKTPAPQGPSMNATPQAPAMGPSLGGSGRGAQIAQQRNMMAKKQQKDSSSSHQGDDRT
jgi:hypothetical protein